MKLSPLTSASVPTSSSEGLEPGSATMALDFPFRVPSGRSLSWGSSASESSASEDSASEDSAEIRLERPTSMCRVSLVASRMVSSILIRILIEDDLTRYGIKLFKAVSGCSSLSSIGWSASELPRLMPDMVIRSIPEIPTEAPRGLEGKGGNSIKINCPDLSRLRECFLRQGAVFNRVVDVECKGYYYSN